MMVSSAAAAARAPDARAGKRRSFFDDNDEQLDQGTPMHRRTSNSGRSTRPRFNPPDDDDDVDEMVDGMSVEELKAQLKRLMKRRSSIQSPGSSLVRSPMSRMSRSPPPEFDLEATYQLIINDIEGRTAIPGDPDGAVYADLTDALNFNHREFVRRVLTKLAKGDRSALICGGNTQSQKTGFKVVMYIIGRYLKIGSVVITKNVAESQDLAAKIKGLLRNRKTAADNVVSQTATGKRASDRDMADILHDSGCIVSAHTGHQVKKNLRAVQACRAEEGFFLIFDEADDYERSPKAGPVTQLETAHANLWRDGQPLMVAAVTATMLPLFTNEMYESVKGHDVFFTKQDNYSGVLDTVPFTDCDGNMIVIPSDGDVPAPKNCYMCPEVWAFYKAAAETPKALLLDVMSPRVLATANNFERSKIIQARFKHVCFVVVTGSEIRVLKPRKQDFDAPRKLNSVKIGDVLTELDKEMPRTPIFVLGYSKMERSISYRADARVPTHMAVSIGGTLSFERLLQTLGRCTGRFFPDGHKVVILSNGLDYDAARAYVRFQSTLVDVMRRYPQSTVADIIGTHKFKDEENFWAFNVRTVAQKRASRSWFFNLDVDEFDFGGDHREGFRAAFKNVDLPNITFGKEILDSLMQNAGTRLTLEQLKTCVEARAEDHVCVTTLLTKSLAKLVKAKLVVKTGMTWMWNDVCCRDM